MARAQLVVAPFAAHLPLGESVALAIGGAFATGGVEAGDGTTARISGFTDTRATVDLRFGPLLLSGHAELPSGEPTVTLREAAVMGVFSADLLPFAVRRWGTGGTVGADAGVGFSWSRTTVSMSLGYSTTSTYVPLTDTQSTYSPGAQARLKGIMDLRFGIASVLSVLVGHQRFEGDVFNGVRMFDPGAESDFIVSIAHPFGARESLLAFGSLNLRGRGLLTARDVRRGFDPLTSSILDPRILGSRDAASRQLIRTGLEVHVARGPWSITPLGELRLLRTGDGLSQGWLASFGASADYKLAGHQRGRRVLVTPFARLRVGKLIVSEEGASGVRGWEAGILLRLSAAS